MPRDNTRPKRNRLEPRTCFRVASCSLNVLAVPSRTASILVSRLWLKLVGTGHCKTSGLGSFASGVHDRRRFAEGLNRLAKLREYMRIWKPHDVGLLSI